MCRSRAVLKSRCHPGTACAVPFGPRPHARRRLGRIPRHPAIVRPGRERCHHAGPANGTRLLNVAALGSSPAARIRRTADDANDGESARRRWLRSVGTSRRETDDVTHRDADESGQRLRHDDLVGTTRIGESTVKDHRPSADRREPATIDQHCHGTGQVLATEVIGTEDQTPAARPRHPAVGERPSAQAEGRTVCSLASC